MVQRKWDVGTKDTREKCVNEIIARIEDQGGADFGIIAANDIIDIVMQNLGPDVYNLGLADARKLLLERLADIEVDLDLLENPR